MKSFRKSPGGVAALAGLSLVLLLSLAIGAHAALPAWIRALEAGTGVESAFFRAMFLPGGEVPFRRPPRESRPALGELIAKEPARAELYSLRALEDEQQLDFGAAEADWKSFLRASGGATAAQLSLADFYHRRLRPEDEIKVLEALGSAPRPASEALLPASEQSSWRAFERIFSILEAQGSPADLRLAEYRRWMARYPEEASLYARYLDFLIAQKDFPGALALVLRYRAQFPSDEVFPVKAEALIEYRRDSIEKGLAVYERSFEPLWSPELISSYFGLLAETHSLRRFLDSARAAEARNPNDLKAAARIFYYYQQQAKLDSAEGVLTRFRLRREAAHAPWTADELYISARLLEDIHSYPESARYYFALYSTSGRKDAQELALAGLAALLLRSPESPIRLGSGDLGLYRDIATMDQGPGYLNGILSLLLNTTSPAHEYSEAELRAVPYFHRAQARQLLALLDQKFPASARRPALHAELIEFYASAGESDAVLRAAGEFLKDFPAAGERTRVALVLADAYARKGRTEDEFRIYDAVLGELAGQAGKIPLGAATAGYSEYGHPRPELPDDQDPGAPEEQERTAATGPAPGNPAFEVHPKTSSPGTGARSPEYSRVLERYLARLVERKQIPQALAVLRRELDENPADPGLYERLAVFLDQNRLGAEEEEVYRRAMARFPDRSWYDKLARFYIRGKRNAEFERLTREAVKAFDGSDLERYFDNLVYGAPEMYLRLNLYAHERFPHDPVFVRNLLAAYTRKETWDPAAWEALLRRHWFEEASFRSVFFEFLSRTGKLASELERLEAGELQGAKWDDAARKNPAAVQYVAEANLWRSHFENAAAPLEALSAEYPADAGLGHRASAVLRSLGSYAPADSARAAKIEERLAGAEPGSADILARIGDIYADREEFRRAAPYWERIPAISPGEAGGYLAAATIYWDYFEFDDALRVLEDGRKRLGNRDLYAYEAGAISEGRRDYARAIREYVRGALQSGGGSPAAGRLVELARRPRYRELADRETQAALSGGPSARALELRVAVLEAQNRREEVAALFEATLARAATIEEAAEIETLAQQKSLESVRQHALEKQASLASDPVSRLQLRYTLAALYESKKDLASAERNYEALYRENPRILGVVRSTVDFYWRRKAYPQATRVLEEAARNSYPELGRQFTLEAARKSTEAKLYPQARTLVLSLLKDSPYDAQYLAALADTYAQAGDSAGLKDFYLQQISLFRSAPFPAEERKTRIAALRRGLIPALTRLADDPGAVDQYIEILNAFPEDEGLAAEAALFAGRHHLEERLLGFYRKTVAESPKDYRWAMVLARSEAALENYPAAIDDYGKAILIRPDRVDLRTARATLAERLMRFDEAVADYERLYELTYKDPAWKAKVAEARARQGRSDQVIGALEAAFVTNRPERPENYFEVARRLESWGMLAGARTFAEKGVQAAGDELLADRQNHPGADLYVRILTRLGQHQAAWPVLVQARARASATLPVLGEQVTRAGMAGVTDSQWRERVRENRAAEARLGLREALTTMGSAVSRYGTPEQKAAFVPFVQKLRLSMNWEEALLFAVPLAESAGLADLEAGFRYEILVQSNLSPEALSAQVGPFVELERRRLKFAELASDMERIAPRLGNGAISARITAAQAYRTAGNETEELRVLEAVSPGYMDLETRNRYRRLLLARRPQQLVLMSSAWDSLGQETADFVVAQGDPRLVHAVVAARGKDRAPVWPKSYNGLAGLYLRETTPEIASAFVSALGDRTIGERIGHPADRNQELAGDIWFYYGSRYGEWLGTAGRPEADDFIAASVEHSPASPALYLALADSYAEAGKLEAARADYQHVLELAPGRSDAHDRLALLLMRQGARAEAIAQWKLFFGGLEQQVRGGRATESFWREFAAGTDHVRSRKVFAELKPAIDSLVRSYLRQNGNYRSNRILRAAYLAAGDSTASSLWIVDLAGAAANPAEILADIADASWISPEPRGPIYRRILEAKERAAGATEGADRENATESWHAWQVRWAVYLLERKQFAEAREFIAALPAETRRSQAPLLVPVELELAARLAMLDARIAEYRADPEAAPGADLLRKAAKQLLAAGDQQSARKILEFVFAREIDGHNLLAPNFLGLAEIRILSGDLPGATELLRRMVLVAGNSYENLDSSAQLLERTGHPAEAAAFLDPLARSTPWEPAYRLRLAKAQIAAGQDAGPAREALRKIASNPEVPYSARVEASLALSPMGAAADLGSAELHLLAGAPAELSAASADRPFFYDARARAADQSADRVVKVRLLVNALADLPSRDGARIPYFYAAAAGPSKELALAAVSPLLRAGILALPPARDGSPEEENAGAEEAGPEPRDSGSYPGRAPAAATGEALTPARQVQLALAVGQALRDLGRPGESVPYLTAARKREADPLRQKEISVKLAAVAAGLAEEAQNRARQPILHQELEQDRVVRPRLLARKTQGPEAAKGEKP